MLLQNEYTVSMHRMFLLTVNVPLINVDQLYKYLSKNQTLIHVLVFPR